MTRPQFAEVMAYLAAGYGTGFGRAMDEPLEPDTQIHTIRYMTLLDKRFVYPGSYYEDPESPKYLEVEKYRIVTPTGQVLSDIHETRCIRFGGAMTDQIRQRENNGWDYSIIQAIYDELRDQESNWQSANTLLADASQAVFKIKGLINSITTPNGEATMRTRMGLVDLSRSVARAVLLDADGEWRLHIIILAVAATSPRKVIDFFFSSHYH